jgi:hypothetical protein
VIRAIDVIVIICVRGAVHVTGGILAAMYVDKAGQAVVKVRWTAQRHCRIAHDSNGRQRLRYRDHRGLLHKQQHGHQHGTADAKAQKSMRARRHLAVLGHRWAQNKRLNRKWGPWLTGQAAKIG